MSRYKVTLGMGQYTYGATESYWTNDLTPSALGPAVQGLINLRNACLFSNIEWDGVRIGVAPVLPGNVGAARRSALFIPGSYTLPISGIDLVVPSVGARPLNTGSTSGDQARSCAQIRMGFDTDRRSMRYMAFVPDVIIEYEPATIRMENDSIFNNAYKALRAELLSGRWSTRARSQKAGFEVRPISKWVSAAAGIANMGAAVPAAPDPGIKEGDFVSVKGVRQKTNSGITYNGKYLVESVDATATPGKVIIFLANSNAGNPGNIKLPGTIQKVGFDYYSFDFMNVMRGGVHKRGGRFTVPVGRRSTRVSLGV